MPHASHNPPFVRASRSKGCRSVGSLACEIRAWTLRHATCVPRRMNGEYPILVAEKLPVMLTAFDCAMLLYTNTPPASLTMHESVPEGRIGVAGYPVLAVCWLIGIGKYVHSPPVRIKYEENPDEKVAETINAAGELYSSGQIDFCNIHAVNLGIFFYSLLQQPRLPTPVRSVA